MRQAIRLTLGLLVGLCLYAGQQGRGAFAQATRQQEPARQATSSSGKTSADAAKSATQSSGASASPAARAGSAQSQGAGLQGRASENLIDASLPEDPELKKIIAPYKTKVEELSVPIGKLTDNLKKAGVGGGSLGNFVADALRNMAEKKGGKPVTLAVVNTSGLRKNDIAAGPLSSSDIFELLPFENAMVTLDLTGEQLLRFMKMNVERRNAQSGARIVYRNNPEKKQNEMVSIKLGRPGAEIEIDPRASYTIATIDYLVKRGGEYSMLQEGKNLRPLGITMRDAVLEYIRAETAAGRNIQANIDGRFTADPKSPGAEDPQR